MFDYTVADTQIDQVIWEHIKESACPEDFHAYLRHKPEGAAHLDEAIDRLIELDEQGATYESEEHRYPAAIAPILTRAQAGNAVAQFHMGKITEFGIGIAADRDAAIGWYKAAVFQGETRSHINLAMMLKDSEHAKLASEAKELYAKAAERGEPAGTFGLAVMAAKGIAEPEGKLPVTREALYDFVWAEPMLKLASRYGVSSSYLARVCAQLNVPRPPRGYWAKLAAGMTTTRPPLPEVAPGDLLEWARDGLPKRIAADVPRPPVRRRQSRIRAAGDRPAHHALLRDVRHLFEVGRETDVGYLRPNKRLLPDVVVSKDVLPRALDVANELFLLFEDRGHQVAFARSNQRSYRQELDEREKVDAQRHYSRLWSPHRPTVVYLGSVAIGLTIFEMTERVEARWEKGRYVRIAPAASARSRRGAYRAWSSEHELPSGRLCIQAYSPYPRVAWHRQWREGRAGEFPEGFVGLVKVLEREVRDIARRVEEARQQAVIEEQQRLEEWRLYQIEAAKRKRAEAVQASREELLAFMKEWASAREIETFLKEVEGRLAGLADPDRSLGLARLEEARGVLGDLDALRLLWSWRSPGERLAP